MCTWPPSYEGAPVIPVGPGGQELTRLRLTLWDVVDILREGYDCGSDPPSFPKFETCLRINGQEIKAVGEYVQYSPFSAGPAWVFWHIKETGR